MTPEQRINELQKRQVYYGSSLVCKLNAEKGYWYYTIYLWQDQGKTDNKSVILSGKYTGQDPEELFKQVEGVIGKQKIGKRKIQANHSPQVQSRSLS